MDPRETGDTHGPQTPEADTVAVHDQETPTLSEAGVRLFDFRDGLLRAIAGTGHAKQGA